MRSIPPDPAPGTHGFLERIRSQRASVDAADAKPQLVVGIGGSGIQTIARVRERIHDRALSSSSAPNARFVGIDIVDPSNLDPPLSSDCSLGIGEFLNLLETPFVATEYIRDQLLHGASLQRWWDQDWFDPLELPSDVNWTPTPCRMVGRIPFDRGVGMVRRRINDAVGSATQAATGGAGSTGSDRSVRLPVYVANSTCGNTGSAGFLLVVLSVWIAAQQRGYVPEIRSIVYLPSVFDNVLGRLNDADQRVRTLEANTYAYLREVSHFVSHGSQLIGRFGTGAEGVGVTIPDGLLLEESFLVGSPPDVGTPIAPIKDTFEYVAGVLLDWIDSNGPGAGFADDRSPVSHSARSDRNRERLRFYRLDVGAAGPVREIELRSLRDFPDWERSYRQATTRRGGIPHRHPPVHIDKRFQEILDPL